MENFICNCIATLMTALAVIATAMFICSFGLIEFGQDTEKYADPSHFLNCSIVDGGAE